LNILTKILIVVMVVLCIIASVLFIHKVNIEPNWRTAHLDGLSAQETYKAQARMAAEIAKRAQAINKDLSTLMQQKAQLASAEMQKLQTENDRLTAENAQHASQLEQMNAGLASLEASVAKQVKMNELISGQLTKRNADLQDVHTQLRDTTLNANALARDLETARQNARVKSDLLSSAEAKIRDLEDKLVAAGGPRGGESAPVPPTEIRGRVTQVSVADGVAQLNVGAASGVREGMRFYLYRGAIYVCDLTVAQVEPNDCAGILSNVQVQPMSRDRATTDLSAD
jgi:hypothetical protein